MKYQALFAALVLVAACGQDLSSPEGIKSAVMDQMESLASLMEGIDSKEAADAAADDVKGIIDNLKPIAEAVKKLDPEAKKALDEAMNAEKGFEKRMQEASVKAGPHIAKSSKFQKAMMDAMRTFADFK